MVLFLYDESMVLIHHFCRDTKSGGIIMVKKVVLLFTIGVFLFSSCQKDETERLFKSGEVLILMGNWKDSLEIFDKVLQRDSSHLGALYYKAQGLSNLNQFEEADRIYGEILDKIEPGSKYFSEVLVSKGTNLMEMNKLEEAEKLFDQALQIDPRLARSWLHKGRIAARRKDYQVSITYCDRAIALNPNDARGWNNKAFALFQLGRIEDCILNAQRAVEIEPRYFMAWYWLSKAYEVKGDVSRTKMCYDNFQKNMGFSEHTIGMKPIQK